MSSISDEELLTINIKVVGVGGAGRSVANNGIVRNNTSFHTVPGFKTPVKLTILVCQTRS